MFNANRSLLTCVPLLPGEWLLSYLTRLANLNQYDSVMWIREILQERLTKEKGYKPLVQNNSLHLPTNAEAIKHLSDLTRQPEKMLIMASAHYFAETLPLVETDLATTQLSTSEIVPLIPYETAKRQTWASHDVRYCPLCLQNGRYHRLQWLPLLVSACLEHRCLLNRGCSSCGQPLSINHIVEDRCASCHTKPSRAPVVDIAQDKWGLLTQQTIHYWLGLAPQPPEYARYWRNDVPARVHLSMVDGLRRNIVRTDDPWSFVNQYYDQSRLERFVNPDMKDKKDWLPANVHLLGATVMNALLNWPDNFYDFLDSYRLRGGREITNVVTEDLGRLYTQLMEKAWRSPEFAFVQDAFDDYVIPRYATALCMIRLRRYVEDADFRERVPFMIEKEAARTLGTNGKIVQRLADMGILPAYDVSRRRIGIGEKPPYRWYKRTDVYALQKKWRETLSLDEAARKLGLQPKAVRNLIKLNILEAVRGPSVDGSTIWAISAKSVNRFYECVQQRIVPLQDGQLPPTTPLEVVQTMSAYHYDLAKIMELVLQQYLTAYRPEGEGDLSAIRFRPEDVERQRQMVQEQTPLVSFWQIAAKMGVGTESVDRWVANGLLPVVEKNGKKRHVIREEVEQFIDEHIFSDVAADLIDVHPDVISKWVRRGRLLAVSGPTIDGCACYLFRRDEVERFMPANRLTAPQVGRLIGKSRSQVSTYIREGKLTPISGPGIDDCKHYLFLRSDLVASGLLAE